MDSFNSCLSIRSDRFLLRINGENTMTLIDVIYSDYKKYQELYSEHSSYDCKETNCDVLNVHSIQAIYSYLHDLVNE